jgi:hypothetical protein
MGTDRSSRAAAGQTGESRRLISSDHAKGAFVYAPDGNRVGRIERVMADAATGEIVHAVVSFTADQHPVPWSLLAYNPRFDGYELRIDGQALHRVT